MNHKKQLYRIAEAADLAGVSPSTLRLWEKKGLVLPDRSKCGHRRYSAAQVTRLELIVSRKKARGLNAAAILETLKADDPLEAGTPPDASRAIPETKKLKQLEDENARLKRMVAEQALELDRAREVISAKGLRPARKREE
jgi:DNA-binding transcriptional MerR regulator